MTSCFRKPFVLASRAFMCLLLHPWQAVAAGLHWLEEMNWAICKICLRKCWASQVYGVLHEHPKKGTGRCTHRNRFPLLILLRHRMCRAHALFPLPSISHGERHSRKESHSIGNTTVRLRSLSPARLACQLGSQKKKAELHLSDSDLITQIITAVELASKACLPKSGFSLRVDCWGTCA